MATPKDRVWPPYNEAAAYMANMRWNYYGSDRDQPRRAGRLGGRPVTCTCGNCPKCKRRWRRNGKKLTALFGNTRNTE